jgi:hypothetical protein
MNETLKSILYWTPRAASIIFILFVSIFAFDVFGQNYGFWELLWVLFLHLIPSLVLLGALIVAWRYEWVGAVLYIGFAVWYLATMWGRFDWSAYAILAGVPILVGLLFGVGWFYRKEIRPS